jgi:hypothetical protein
VTALASAQASVVLRVDKDQTTNPSPDGLTWAAAFPTLTAALADARARFNTTGTSDDVSQIWVAEGTYKPTTSTTDRTATFQLVPGAAVYGGFVGTEGSLPARAGNFNQTILSGDIDGDPRDQSLDSLHVVTVGSEAGEFRLDGFQVMLGSAIPSSPSSNPTDDYGGGLLVTGLGTTTHVIVRDVKFQACLAGIGGGAFVERARLDLSRSNFSACVASLAGSSGTLMPNGAAGALMVKGGEATYVYHSVFVNNRGTYGGAMGVIDTRDETRIVNCLVTNNTSLAGGGLIVGDTNVPVVVDHCTFSGNLALAPSDTQSALFLGGGAIHVLQSTDSLEVRSSIVWGNTDQNQIQSGSHTIAGAGAIPSASYGAAGVVVTYSDFDIGTSTPTWFATIPGTSLSANNLVSNPLFVNAGLGNYRLTVNSPCLDAADDLVIDLTAVPTGSGATAWNGGLGDILDIDGDGITVEHQPFDLDFSPREADGTAGAVGRDFAEVAPRVSDMGCYEYQGDGGSEG